MSLPSVLPGGHQLAQRLELGEIAFLSAWAQALLTGGPAGEPPALLPFPPGGAYFLTRDGIGNFNRAIGLGLWEPLTDGMLDAVEAFYRERGAGVMLDISPFHEPQDLAVRLTERGYHPQGWLSMLYRPLSRGDGDLASLVPLRVEEVGPEKQGVFGRVLAEGYESPAFRQLAPTWLNCQGCRSYLAYVDGQPVGGAVMYCRDGMVVLFGAATLPAFRRRGVQRALLLRRLADAAASGCSMAGVETLPESESEVNALKAGFQLAYHKQRFVKP